MKRITRTARTETPRRICLVLPDFLLEAVKAESNRLPVPNDSAVIRAALVAYLGSKRNRVGKIA